MRVVWFFLCSIMLYLPTYAQEIPYRENNRSTRAFRRAESPSRSINPSARGCPENDGFYITADCLYWKAGENDLYYAQDAECPVNPIPTEFISNAKYRQSHGIIVPLPIDWKLGFRAGCGWNIPYDGWDLGLDYTRYRNISISSVVSPSYFTNIGGIMLGGWLAITDDQSFPNSSMAVKATGKRSLKYDSGNLELGRAFFTSKVFSLRPFLGAKVDRLDRRTSNSYDRIHPQDFNAVDRYVAITRFLGYGPQIGMGMDFHLGYGLQLLGKASTAMLFGKTSSKLKTIELGYLVADNRVKPYWKNIPELELNIGLGWGRCFSKDTKYFSLKAMWEVTEFFSMPRNLFAETGDSLHLISEQTIYLTGVTLHAKFDF